MTPEHPAVAALAPVARTQLYLSHSYRSRDRRVNEFFWELFWEAGFTFAVDPRSSILSVPYLEYMMKGSAGYAAIVTYRPKQKYRCSPYVLYEFGLALLAHKPRVLFVESDVSSRYFEQEQLVEIYQPSESWLKPRRQQFAETLQKFAEFVRPYSENDQKLRRRAGILIQPGRPAYGQMTRIKAAVENPVSIRT